MTTCILLWPRCRGRCALLRFGLSSSCDFLPGFGRHAEKGGSRRTYSPEDYSFQRGLPLPPSSNPSLPFVSDLNPFCLSIFLPSSFLARNGKTYMLKRSPHLPIPASTPSFLCRPSCAKGKLHVSLDASALGKMRVLHWRGFLLSMENSRSTSLSRPGQADCRDDLPCCSPLRMHAVSTVNVLPCWRQSPARLKSSFHQHGLKRHPLPPCLIDALAAGTSRIPQAKSPHASNQQAQRVVRRQQCSIGTALLPQDGSPRET